MLFTLPSSSVKGPTWNSKDHKLLDQEQYIRVKFENSREKSERCVNFEMEKKWQSWISVIGGGKC